MVVRGIFMAFGICNQTELVKSKFFRSARTSRTVSVRRSVRRSVELNENTNNTCIPTTVLYSIILYSTIWYSTVLYGTVLCCMVQYSTAYYSTRLLEHAL